MAENIIRGQLIKPFLGRPYLKLGQCFGLWGYLFELGGMLGSKHRAKLDAFLPAFVGMSGEAGAAEHFPHRHRGGAGHPGLPGAGAGDERADRAVGFGA